MALHASTITIVAPNSKTTTPGTADTLAPFGDTDYTFQWAFKASQFATVPIGSTITAIGFRQSSTDPTAPNVSFTLPNWNLQLSSTSKAIGSLATQFLSNIGADVVTVYSGPLTVPAGGFVGGGSPSNPFFLITLTTPYTYKGGNLLTTLRKQGAGPKLWVDAANVNSVGDTVGFGTFTATGGTAEFYNYPITEYVFSTSSVVPEPSTCALLGSGLLGFVALTLRRRR